MKPVEPKNARRPETSLPIVRLQILDKARPEEKQVHRRTSRARHAESFSLHRRIDDW
jgi:hypothetical protein